MEAPLDKSENSGGKDKGFRKCWRHEAHTWNAEAMEAMVIYNIYFKSRIASGVVYLPGMDFENWHSV